MARKTQRFVDSDIGKVCRRNDFYIAEGYLRLHETSFKRLRGLYDPYLQPNHLVLTRILAKPKGKGYEPFSLTVLRYVRQLPLNYIKYFNQQLIRL